MNLREKVIHIFYKTATGSRQIRNLLTPVGLIVFLGFIVLIIFISLQVDRYLRLPKLLPQPLHLFISIPGVIIGLFLILWSMLHFLKVKGTPVPFNPPPKLVLTGPYAYVRNPMLTGVFIVLFGLGVYFRSSSLFFIFTPLFIFLNFMELKHIEEPELEKRLGKAYVEYKNKTPMFIPWLNRRNDDPSRTHRTKP